MGGATRSGDGLARTRLAARARSAGVFALADPARINDLVVAAGFGEPEIEQFELTWGYGDGDEYWRLITELGAPLRAALGSSMTRSASPCGSRSPRRSSR